MGFLSPGNTIRTAGGHTRSIGMRPAHLLPGGENAAKEHPQMSLVPESVIQQGGNIKNLPLCGGRALPETRESTGGSPLEDILFTRGLKKRPGTFIASVEC